MINFLTNLEIVDNTGAKKAECIKVLGGHKKQIAKVGEKVVSSIKKATPKGLIKKGDVHKILIIRTKNKINRKDGSKIYFFSNSAVVLNDQQQPVGSRIFGPITKELKNKQNLKVVSLVKKII